GAVNDTHPHPAAARPLHSVERELGRRGRCPVEAPSSRASTSRSPPLWPSTTGRNDGRQFPFYGDVVGIDASFDVAELCIRVLTDNGIPRTSTLAYGPT